LPAAPNFNAGDPLPRNTLTGTGIHRVDAVVLTYDAQNNTCDYAARLNVLGDASCAAPEVSGFRDNDTPLWYFIVAPHATEYVVAEDYAAPAPLLAMGSEIPIGDGHTYSGGARNGGWASSFALQSSIDMLSAQGGGVVRLGGDRTRVYPPPGEPIRLKSNVVIDLNGGMITVPTGQTIFAAEGEILDSCAIDTVNMTIQAPTDVLWSQFGEGSLIHLDSGENPGTWLRVTDFFDGGRRAHLRREDYELPDLDPEGQNVTVTVYIDRAGIRNGVVTGNHSGLVRFGVTHAFALENVTFSRGADDSPAAFQSATFPASGVTGSHTDGLSFHREVGARPVGFRLDDVTLQMVDSTSFPANLEPFARGVDEAVAAYTAVHYYGPNIRTKIQGCAFGTEWRRAIARTAWAGHQDHPVVQDWRVTNNEMLTEVEITCGNESGPGYSRGVFMNNLILRGRRPADGLDGKHVVVPPSWTTDLRVFAKYTLTDKAYVAAAEDYAWHVFALDDDGCLMDSPNDSLDDEKHLMRVVGTSVGSPRSRIQAYRNVVYRIDAFLLVTPTLPSGQSMTNTEWDAGDLVRIGIRRYNPAGTLVDVTRIAEVSVDANGTETGLYKGLFGSSVLSLPKGYTADIAVTYHVKNLSGDRRLQILHEINSGADCGRSYIQFTEVGEVQ
jgi:hypothetical protein